MFGHLPVATVLKKYRQILEIGTNAPFFAPSLLMWLIWHRLTAAWLTVRHLSLATHFSLGLERYLYFSASAARAQSSSINSIARARTRSSLSS